jgi:DNA-binding Lrp family transcriptional regulator
VKKINSTEIISRYSISVNFPKMGLLWLSILVKITNKTKEKEFIAHVIGHPQTVNVIENLGDWDLEITFYAKNIDEADKYMLDLREKYYDIILDYKFFITKDGLKYPQVAEGIFENFNEKKK